MGGRKNIDDVIREYLSRKTPDGYYIIPASLAAREIVAKYNNVVVEETGTILFIKTRSRSIAEKVLRKLWTRNLLGEYS